MGVVMTGPERFFLRDIAHGRSGDKPARSECRPDSAEYGGRGAGRGL